jgi:hypothetical protein
MNADHATATYIALDLRERSVINCSHEPPPGPRREQSMAA